VVRRVRGCDLNTSLTKLYIHKLESYVSTSYRATRELKSEFILINYNPVLCDNVSNEHFERSVRFIVN
jgi:hypothetical protein